MTGETVFEMGQKVNVWTEEERFICEGVVDGIHHPEEPDGEEFYDVQPVDAPYGRFDHISEMRLTEASR
jgi:hypothetical protein